MSRRSYAISARLLGFAALGAAGSLIACAAVAGEGSGSNNAGLLRGSISECAPTDNSCNPFGDGADQGRRAPMQLETPRVVDVADPNYGYPVGQVPHAVEVLAAPEEVQPPPFDLDWSVGLRGAYVNNSSTGARYEALVSPNASLTYEGTRARAVLGGSADLVRTSTTDLRISAMRLSLGTDYRFDRDMQIETNGALNLTQANPDDPSVANGITDAPLTFVGTLDSTLTRQFGRLEVALRGNLERDVYGDTTLVGGITQDNSGDNRNVVGGGLRVAYALTPIVKVFVDGDAAHDYYDAVSPSLGVRADGTTYALKSGLSGQWGETLSAEASIGTGLRRFDASGLADVTATLYDGRIVFKPNETLALTGAFTTAFTPPGPNGSGIARVDHVASADASYKVNSWLTLRALANWNWAELVGTPNTERGYGYGFGADYTLNSHTALNADYGFSHTETVSKPLTDEHRVTLGVTISR